ncbi:MAG TPA: hypothetical protein VKE27_07210 [Candidatus Dormibacteraeota bacterium]|nr:hypothetical protein [Candidatus Dormibacteraeota bacterium]
MIRSGLRRLAIAFGVIFALTSVISLIIGAIAHANLQRAVAIGFYIAGAGVLVGCFIFGLKGPVRADYGSGDNPELPLGAAQPGVPMRSVLMPRSIRRSTPEERVESKRNALALFALGIVLIFIAAAFDPRRHAF